VSDDLMHDVVYTYKSGCPHERWMVTNRCLDCGRVQGQTFNSTITLSSVSDIVSPCGCTFYSECNYHSERSSLDASEPEDDDSQWTG
jgi:hypothetical protein